jgi:hypothetical protein
VLADWGLIAPNIYVHDLQKETSQVFVNDRLLQQVGGTVFDGYPENAQSAYRNLHSYDGEFGLGAHPVVAFQSLPAESFWYDRNNKRLYVRTAENLRDPTVRVEASQRERVLFMRTCSSCSCTIWILSMQHVGDQSWRGVGGVAKPGCEFARHSCFVE